MKKLLILIIILSISIFSTSCNLNNQKDDNKVQELEDKKSHEEVNEESKEDEKEDEIEKNPDSLDDKENKDERPEENKKVVIETKVKNINKQWYNAYIEMPVINGLAEEETEEELNDLIQNEIIDFSNHYEIEGKNVYEEQMKLNNINPQPFNVDISYDVRNNKNGILSITVLYYFYTGGAHGMTDQAVYNIDLNTGQLITLDDLFIDYFDYVAAINDEINRQIEIINEEDIKNQLEEGVSKDDLYILFNEFSSIRKDHEFYFSGNQLVVYFDIYEIAPYAAGIPTFPINFTILEQGLNNKAKQYFD